MRKDVSEQGRDHTTLGSPLGNVFTLSIHQHICLECEQAELKEHWVTDVACDNTHQQVMRDGVEVFSEVSIENPNYPSCADLTGHLF